MFAKRTRLAAIFFFWVSVIRAQDPEVSPGGNVTIWYPVATNGTLLEVNAIDTLVVSWDTQFQAVNISMWCLTNQSLASPYVGWPLSSPRPANDNFIIQDINDNIHAKTFPVLCHFAFTNAYDKIANYDGGTFRMTSTQGEVRTWSRRDQLTTLVPAVASSVVVTQSPILTMMTLPSPTVPVTTASSTAVNPSPSGTKAHEGTLSSLSMDAKAGIIVAVLAVVLGILIGLGIWYWRKKFRPAATPVETSQIVPPEAEVNGRPSSADVSVTENNSFARVRKMS